MADRGSRLIEAMRARGLSKQHALAFSLGVNESTVTRWKNDGPMSLENAISLCRVLDVSMDWLLLGIGSMDRAHPEVQSSLEDQRVLLLFRELRTQMSGPLQSLFAQLLNAVSRRQ